MKFNRFDNPPTICGGREVTEKHPEHLASGGSTATRVPAPLTDLAMTRLCAEAMGLPCRNLPASVSEDIWNHCQEVKIKDKWVLYDPLHDDAQAMALVKKFKLVLVWGHHVEKGPTWYVDAPSKIDEPSAAHADLNRAIVECVARMQDARSTTENNSPTPPEQPRPSEISDERIFNILEP